MPYFPTLDVVFVHIPKTGGTSVEGMLAKVEGIPQWKPVKDNRLAKYLFGPGPVHSLQHSTWSEISEWATSRDISLAKSRVFAVVRDPWKRIVSEINFQMTHSPLFPGTPTAKSMAKGPYTTYRAYVNQVVLAKLKALESNLHLDDCHWRPQTDFLKGSDGNIDPTISIFPLDHALETSISDFLSCPLRLPHMQTSAKIHPGHSPEDLFDPEVQALVQEIYREDFILFQGLSEASKK